MTMPPISAEESHVNVWHATSSQSQPGLVEWFCERWLSESERERADRFRVATSRNQHIVGRGMARHLLGPLVRNSISGPEAIEFDFLPHGKPFVRELQELNHVFNIAHTDGLVLCGLGQLRSRMLGVDVERTDRKTDTELASRYFSLPEVDYVFSFSEPAARRYAFLKVWTLKEAFIKAIGTGLHTPLSDFAFENIDGSSPTIKMLSPKLDQQTEWRFFSFHPRVDYIAAIAVAIDDGDQAVSLRLCDFDSVVSCGSEPLA